MPRTPKKGARIACIITGKEKYIAECFLEKKIAKYGSIDQYRNWYVSNQAKRCLKKGMTFAEAREHLGSGQDLPAPDLEILFKLKLLKKKRKAATPDVTDEDREASRQVAVEREKAFQAEVKAHGREGALIREFTGIGTGGTCFRPDIFLSRNDETCDGCEFYEHCLCENKRLEYEPRRKR